MTVYDLPAVNASLNALSAALLALGYYFIRRKKVNAHRNCMLAAFCTSTLFLTCYLIYHYFARATTFKGHGWIRPVYFSILGSHTILAVAVVPMVLVTLFRAYRQRFERHRAIARWTLPVWLYVSVTGVLVYWILYHLYPSR